VKKDSKIDNIDEDCSPFSNIYSNKNQDIISTYRILTPNITRAKKDTDNITNIDNITNKSDSVHSQINNNDDTINLDYTNEDNLKYHKSEGDLCNSKD